MRKRTNILTAIAACFICALGSQSHGQYFVPPVAYNFDYNSAALPNTATVSQTANFAISNIPVRSGNSDLYLAAWSTHGGANGEVTYQFTAPGNPSALLYQDTLQIPNASEITVGSVRLNSDDYILVAYLYLGATPSYRINLYQINTASATPVSPPGTLILSTNPGGDGRISMDCHRQYGVVVAYPTPAGIETRVANTSGGMLALSLPVLLTGTAGNLSPDVAFNHFNGGMNLHYVYYNPSTYVLTESVLDYSMVLASPVTSMAPTVQDINPLPAVSNNFFRYIRPVIDCPDHYDVDNWAYTYTYNTNFFPDGNGMPTDGIFVRFVDHHSTGVPTTVNVADGSLSNAPCLDYYPIFPTLCYGEDVLSLNTGQIHVAWYNQLNPTQDGGMFVAVHMSEDGSGFLSMPDYLVIPNPVNSFAVNTSFVINLLDYYINPIALSKNSDAMFNIAPNFLYTTYLHETGPFSYSLSLNHVFHEWGNNNAYKGTPPPVAKRFTGHCGPQDLKQRDNNMQVQPNPFLNVARASFNLEEDGRLQLQLSDFLGRVVWQQEETAAKGTRTAQLDNLQKLPAGAYVLKGFLNGKQIGTKKIIKQQ